MDGHEFAAGVTAASDGAVAPVLKFGLSHLFDCGAECWDLLNELLAGHRRMESSMAK